MTIKQLFGRNVRYYRKQRCWSQEKLAEESGLHRTYISGVELGNRNPTLTVAEKIANALGVSLPCLLQPEEPRQ